MIPRYSRPEMAHIWTDENRFSIWQEIEVLASEAMAELGKIPKESAKNIRKKANFDIARIDEIEKETRHDVIAFLTSMAEFIGEDSRFVHQGLTSSDVVDTALSVQLTQACDILLADVEKLMAALKAKAMELKDVATIGRSHGIHGEPTSFGLKFAGYYAEFDRNLTRLKHARDEVAVCALSGAIGTFANIDPKIEAYVADKLKLKTEPLSTQVIPRDRHAVFFTTLAVIAGSIERIAIEIRHLQRTEIREVEESFGIGQKGSSAMPHKRNPILSENLTGLARLVRMSAAPALENIALWHERDISHSSVERVIAPDTTVTLDFALNRLTVMVEKLTIYPDQIERNLQLTHGLYNSQRVLLALTQKGMSREDAYRIVQTSAMSAWKNRSDLRKVLEQNAKIMDILNHDELDELFKMEYHLRYVNEIYDRVFN